MRARNLPVPPVTLNHLIRLSGNHGVKLRWDAELDRFQRVCTSDHPLPRSIENFVNDDRDTPGGQGFAIGATRSS